jgi:hypothetical protein
MDGWTAILQTARRIYGVVFIVSCFCASQAQSYGGVHLVSCDNWLRDCCPQGFGWIISNCHNPEGKIRGCNSFSTLMAHGVASKPLYLFDPFGTGLVEDAMPRAITLSPRFVFLQSVSYRQSMFCSRMWPQSSVIYSWLYMCGHYLCFVHAYILCGDWGIARESLHCSCMLLRHLANDHDIPIAPFNSIVEWYAGSPECRWFVTYFRISCKKGKLHVGSAHQFCSSTGCTVLLVRSVRMIAWTTSRVCLGTESVSLNKWRIFLAMLLTAILVKWQGDCLASRHPFVPFPNREQNSCLVTS